jgi:hypothetical protein
MKFRIRQRAAMAMLLGGVALVGRSDASGLYSDAVLATNPTHFYQLDETSVGAPRLDGSGNKIPTRSGAGGFQYDGPAVDTGVTDTPINGFYEGFWSGIDTERPRVGTVGFAGPAFPGFDANNRSLDINDAGSVNLGPGSNFAASTMTVSFWMKGRNAHTGDRYWTNNQASGDNHLQITLGNAANFVVGINPNVEDETGSLQVDGSTVSVKDNQWHHVVVSRSGPTMAGVRVVIDGYDFTSQMVSSTTGWGITPNDAHIGSRDGGDGGSLERSATGSMDEVAVWMNRQLTSAEAKALYNAAVPTGAALPAELPSGGNGKWGIRAVRPRFLLKNGLEGADKALADVDHRVERDSTDSTASVLNFSNGGDDISFGATKDAAPAGSRGSNYAVAANGTIRIPESGTYTFGFDGDNAVRLTVGGATFTKQAGGEGVAATGGTLEQSAFTTNAYGLASTFLEAGDYPISVVYAEQGGGGFLEVFAAKGEKTAMDNDFALIGGQAATYAQGTTPSVPGGFNVKETVRVPENDPLTAITNLAQAREAALNPNATDQPFVGNRPTINFTDPEAPGTAGKYPGESSFLNDFTGNDDNDFAMLATATVHIEADGVYTFGFDSDNGASLTIDGAAFEITRSIDTNVAAVLDGGETVAFDRQDFGTSYTLASTFLTAGDHALEFLMFERNGGASAELFAAVGKWNAFYAPAFTLLGEPARAVNISSPAGLQLVGDDVPVTGDTDGDGDVDLTDLNNVRNNFGGTTGGDTNGDGLVDLVDLNNVRNNFGATAGSAVPEPASAGLALVLTAIGGYFLRRRKS